MCGKDDLKVKDSRPTDDDLAVRRRRECLGCGFRFTTYERVYRREFTVVKSDGRRQRFEHGKLARSMAVALQKRPVNADLVAHLANGIEREIESSGETAIRTETIGALAMRALANLDDVAFVRYASVYLDFREPADFQRFIGQMDDSYPRASQPGPDA